MQCSSGRLLHAWVQEVTQCGIKFDHRFASRARRQVKSAPTPAGELNVRAEAEKRKIYTPKKCQTLYNLQPFLTELRRSSYTHTHTIPVRVKATVCEGHEKLLEQKSRKHGTRESHRAAFLATISQLPQTLYLQNISNFVSQVCCGRPRGGYVVLS